VGGVEGEGDGVDYVEMTWELVGVRPCGMESRHLSLAGCMVSFQLRR